MRPHTTSRKPEFAPNNLSMSSSNSSNVWDMEELTGSSFDLSTMLSTPIFVDMACSLYEKVNADVQTLAENDNNWENRNCADNGDCALNNKPVSRANNVVQPENSVVQPEKMSPEAWQQQAFVSSSTQDEQTHQQPVRRNPINPMPEQTRQNYSDSLHQQEPPVLARIPKLPKIDVVQSKPYETNSSFEDLMAQTISGIEQMSASASQTNVHFRPESSKINQTTEQIAEQVADKPMTSKSNSEVHSTLEKREKFLSSINWGSFRRLLFNRETIKLGFLTIVVCSFVVAGTIYKCTNSSQKPSLVESDMEESQPAALTETSEPVQNAVTTVPPNHSSDPEFSSEQVATNPVVPMNQPPMSGNSYQTSVESDPFNTPAIYPNEQEQYVHQPQNAPAVNGNMLPTYNNDIATLPENNPSYSDPNAGLDAMPQFNSTPEYAPVTPAVGNQYSPSDYESPVLEEEPLDYAGSGIPNNEMR